MNRQMSVSVCLVCLTLVPVSEAQESTAPIKSFEPRADTLAVSPIEAAVEAELADRQRQEQAVAWLSKPCDVHFTETPLKDVVAYLADLHKARIRLDAAVLTASRNLENSPITMSVSG